MLDFFKVDYLIEIWLVFDGNDDKILKIHLNPYDSSVKKLFNLVVKNRSIAIHYYNKASKIFATSITILDDEHYDWFVRNNYLLSRLIPQRQQFSVFSDTIAKKFSNSDRFYHHLIYRLADNFVTNISKLISFDDKSGID